MKKLMAIKIYLEKGSVVGKISLKEFKEFIETCTEEEKQAFAETSAKELEVELEE